MSDYFPKPNNSVDDKANYFQVPSLVIGYVVCETLDEAHLALAQHQIHEVRFGWIKFKINWHHSGLDGMLRKDKGHP